MRRILLVSLLCLCSVSVARADEASKRAKVEEIFTLTHLDVRMKQIADAGAQQAKAFLAKLPPEDGMTDEQKSLTHDFEKGIVSLIENSVGWATLKPEYIALYANTYTEEELDGLLVFYKSPIGQKVLAKTPELTNAMIEISKRASERLKPQFDELMQAYLDKMSKT